MNGVTVYEFDVLVPAESGALDSAGLVGVPPGVFDWLDMQCLRASEAGGATWLQRTQRRGRPAIQVTSYVGVIRAPDDYQIEVLPKVGRVAGSTAEDARKLLIDMLRCLPGFRHIQTLNAHLAAARMPLLEVFVREFLLAVERVVKRGLRSDFTAQQDNVTALRGKLLFAENLRQNLCRADRFFTEHDTFSSNRPENRLLHAALRRVLVLCTSQPNQQLARELCNVFADVPATTRVAQDFQQVRMDRGMGSYADALAWARIVLENESPLTGMGAYRAPSLLFPMEAVFEAFVARHLGRKLRPPLVLQSQACGHHLVNHRSQNWFWLKPDLLVREGNKTRVVLDTKWKLLDHSSASGTDKYGLSQADFYQLYAYGQTYLDGTGDLVLVYPRTERFTDPLPVFEFPKAQGLRLWVLPFCLRTRVLHIPQEAPFADCFDGAGLFQKSSTGLFSSPLAVG